MENSLDNVIEKLKFKSNQKAADILGCTRANIHKRRRDGSPISKEEIYNLYDHALKMGWYNQISVLQPLVDQAFPRLRIPEQMLAEFTIRPWKDLVLFLPTLEDARVVYELLGQDMRASAVKRTIQLFIPSSARLLDDVIDLFTDQHRLRLRYELTVSFEDNLPFLSGLLIADDKLVLQASSAGFLRMGDIASERCYQEAIKLIRRARSPEYGPVFVQSASVEPERLPGASDGNSIIIHYNGQLGGEYRLTVICDDLPDDNHQWRLRLSLRNSPPIDTRSVELFDQAGRTIIKTHTDNLPWQGIWSDSEHPILIHIDELQLTEVSAS